MALDSQIRDKCLELLIAVQAFEKYWAYYSFSSGNLYDEQAMTSGKLFVDKLEEITDIYPEIWNSRHIAGQIDSNRQYFLTIVDDIAKWAETGNIEIIENRTSFEMKLSILSMILNEQLIDAVNLDVHPPITLSNLGFGYTDDVQKWSAHIPDVRVFIRHNNVKEFTANLHVQETIVVVADIRRSQDLMTYAVSSQDFAERMGELLSTGRKLISSYGGIFDKFTGDGLIAYFNEATNKAENESAAGNFTEFCKEFLAFCNSHFEKWNRTVSKLPHEMPGMAIGADKGNITFDLVDGHLVAVGAPIVWASRLAGVAKSGEVAINNHLWHSLEKQKLDVDKRLGNTKAGEEFFARVWKPAAM